jgi:lambda family phage tail tape measure protein
MAGEVGSVGINVVADTTGVQVGMVQAATITERELKRIAKFVKDATDAQKNMAHVTKDAANAGSYEKMAVNAEKVRGAHAGVNRELLVLTHELSQGNYSKFGGSMLVLAERTNALEYAMTAAGAATLGSVAAGIGFIAMAAAGAIEADKFAKSLQLTGNYAALNETSLMQLAKAQTAVTGQTVAGARASLEAAAGSGLFGPQAVASVARAMGDYERITGASAEEALKKFQSIQDGVAKWAEEENKQMHFLSLAEYDRIKALEEAGNKEQAAIETVNTLAQALESRGTPAVGAFAASWGFVKKAVGDAVEAMKGIGRPDTLADHINDAQRNISNIMQQTPGSSGRGREPELIAAHAELDRLIQQQYRDTEHLAAASLDAAKAQAGISGQNYVEEILKKGKATSAYTEALVKFRAAAAAAAGAGRPFSAEDIKAGEAEIKKQYTVKGSEAQANEYANLVASVKAFNAQTDEEISRQGKLTEAQQYSIRAHEELEKSGKKLTASQRATISAAIDEAAAHRTVAQAMLDAEKATIARVQADTVNQESQRALTTSVIQAGGDQANAIYRQMALIGKSTDEVFRIQELQKFDDMVGKALLGADNDTVSELNKISAAMRGGLVQAIDSAKAAQDAFNASFENGVNKSMHDYIKTVQNQAAQGEQVFNDAVGGMTDALTQFAMTGKLSFKSLADSIIQDLIRIQVQKGFAALLGSGDGLGNAGAGDYSSAGLTAAFGYANGLDYVPYDGYPAILHEGEKVSSKQDAKMARSAGGAVHIDMSGANYSFGAGVNASEVAQQVQAGNAQLEGRMRRLLSNGSIRA